MRRLPLALLLLCALAPLAPRAAAAQGIWVTPPKPLDPQRQGVRDAVVQLRDSLSEVSAAAAALRRDFIRTSDASLVSRARRMRDACARAGRMLPRTRKVLTDFTLADPEPKAHRTALLNQIDSLGNTLDGCVARFGEWTTPGQGEQVRGYGNDAASRLKPALQRYEYDLKVFLDDLKIDIMPAGPGMRPLAG